ncbi:MAG: DUF3788 domain-containing protein [Acidobacteriia bacterium]|nr:DUF3788 domain-containing protein [Terriglobia bacterium]
MLPNAFIGKEKKPTEAELAAELGPAKSLWDRLIAELADESNIVTQEWNSYSPKAGWLLRLKREKRTILYLSPCRGCFRASLALGEKAVQAARQSGLPQRVMKVIDEAKRYAEGTGVRIDVNGPGDIPIVKKLAAVKLEN